MFKKITVATALSAKYITQICAHDKNFEAITGFGDIDAYALKAELY